MPGPAHRGDPIPDVPASVPGDYAAAYRAAYQRALEDLEQVPAGTLEEPPADEAGEVVPDSADPHVPDAAYADRAAARPDPAPWSDLTRATEYRTRSRWLAPVVMAAVALLFVGCAYALGRMASGGSDAPTASPSRSDTRTSGGTRTASPSDPPGDNKPSKPEAKAWRGAVRAVAPLKVTTDCRAPDGVDAAGHKVSYRPSLMIDGRVDTAWRCEGKALGQRIGIRLPAGTKVAEVGLIPGYAKTDPRTRADRFAENNRITRVTWFLPGGKQIRQSMSGDSGDRSMRTVRVPVTTGENLVLRVDAVARGSRNTTMISELRVAVVRR